MWGSPLSITNKLFRMNYNTACLGLNIAGSTRTAATNFPTWSAGGNPTLLRKTDPEIQQ